MDSRKPSKKAWPTRWDSSRREARRLGIPTARVWPGRSTLTCVSFGCSTRGGRTASSTRSIPDRAAILLIAADKTGNDRFYERVTPIADRLYDEHLQQLKREGLT